MKKSITDPTFGMCDNCGGLLDYRDLYKQDLCVTCRKPLEERERERFLNGLQEELGLELRIARLEALFYDHELGHPKKDLQW